MATDEPQEPSGALPGVGEGDWAEALVDPKDAGDSEQGEQGGVLSGDASRPMHGAGADASGTVGT